MIKNFFIIGFLVFNILSCKDLIKNENPKIDIEEGAVVIENDTNVFIKQSLGIYVGMFEADYENEGIQDKALSAGEAFRWYRDNKISIFIDEIKNSLVKGHSVVAGNMQNFEGPVFTSNKEISVIAKEPGNTKFDGTFSFRINDTAIIGTWETVNNIEIKKRKFILLKRNFEYNPSILLQKNVPGFNSRFVDWTKPKYTKKDYKEIRSKMNKEEMPEFDEFFEISDFASATDSIYTINSSTLLLKDKDVENLTKGDLFILRNTIYARHGYSFKFMPLRVFFDKQPWYIPITNNIKSDFTDIEKNNIKLILKYEKLAKEYYDYFGRG